MTFSGTTINCPLCDASPASHEEVADRSRDGSPLRSVLCRECGMVFTNPMPTLDEVSDFYSTRYRTEYKQTYQPRQKHILRSARRALPRLERIRGLGHDGGSILDVGSGGGEFLYLMRLAGFDVKGIEPNAGYGEYSRDEYALDITVNTLEGIAQIGGPFDVITIHHVLEHMRDPVAALTLLGQWLTDDGVLVVEVPNIEANYHAPGSRYHLAHVLHFSSATLARTGERAGLTPISTEFTPEVQHVNVAFSKQLHGTGSVDVRESAVASRTLASLRGHTRASHWLSHYPYLRLAQNLARPVQERLALGGSTTPREVLDSVYRDVTHANAQTR